MLACALLSDIRGVVRFYPFKYITFAEVNSASLCSRAYLRFFG
ncbi:hypothetical protein [Helicobacter himalayensis]|nr:hypothetical protein [Helicobacter himalayensis]